MSFRDAYTRFRGGKAFFVSLSVGIAVWIIVNETIVRFDPSYGKLNLLLSVEASVVTSMLLMAGQTNAEMQQKQLRYQLHITEALYAYITHKSPELIKKEIEHGE